MESLLGAPFHLKDGDTIGVKVLIKPLLFKNECFHLIYLTLNLSIFPQNLLIDNNRNFVTLEDEQGQQKLAEQQRKG